MHDSVNQLFLTTFRIFFHEAENLDALEFGRGLLQIFDYFLNMLNRLRLVVFNRDGSLSHSEHLLDDGDAHYHLLSLFEKSTEVRSKVRLAFTTVYDKHIAFLSRRRRKLHVSREGSSTETDDAAHLDLVHDGLVVVSEFCNESVCTVNALYPLVAFHLYFNAGLHVAGEILARSDGLHCSENR